MSSWCSHCGMTPCAQLKNGRTERIKPVDPCKRAQSWCSGCGMKPCAKSPK